MAVAVNGCESHRIPLGIHEAQAAWKEYLEIHAVILQIRLIGRLFPQKYLIKLVESVTSQIINSKILVLIRDD